MKNEKISQFLKRRSKMEDDETEQVVAASEILPPSYHIAKTIQDLLALGLGIFTIYTCITGLWTDVIQRSTFMAFVMPMVYLNAFTKKRKEYGFVMKFTAVIFAILSAFVFIFTAINYTTMGTTYGALPPLYLFVATAGILLVLEAARRMIGPAISIISIVFILYGLFGKYLPGVLSNRGYDWTRIAKSLFISSSGVFGTPLGTACTIIIMFVIFGAFLEATRGSDLFMDISFALTGRSIGGPAKAAVVSSAMVGCISGSASANVATTGVFTIPLMKKAGYPAYYAGAVEAVASTGSQIMPPIMGSVAFIIAETLGLSFRNIAAAAIIPALLYYISVYFSVHFESCKRGLVGMDEADIPNVKVTLKKYGTSIIPLFILIGMIVAGYSAMYTALYATIAAIVIALFILGMGLPTAPAYMLVAVLVAPALTEMGVPELAAHLFVFYGACLSSITPPVAMAAYTAAGIANDSPIKIGVQAVKLALVTYIMPIFFVYAPELIGQGTPVDIVLAMISGVVGCFGLSIGVVGFFKTKLNPVFRTLAFCGGLCCIFPGLVTDILGYGLILGIALMDILRARKATHNTVSIDS